MTLRQQLLHSHLRVAGLAALVVLVVVLALQMLREPITVIQWTNVPSADAAMTVQLGLQRSEANLRGWVALEDLALRRNVEQAWSREIRPAFSSLQSLSDRQSNEERQRVLSSLDEKLNRLKKLQDWTIQVAAKAGNEPARLVFSQEFGPKREQLVAAIDDFVRSYPDSANFALESFFQLRLSLSEAESALGRFVVEGHEADVTTYQRHIDRVHTLLESFDSSQTAASLIPEQLQVLNRLSESIIDSRRSPRSNVAWHTIGTRVGPLSAEIESELARIADLEVSEMRRHVDEIATWINIMSISSVVVLLFVVAITLLLSNAQASRISAPVRELFRATEALKDGDFGESLRPKGVREVRGLIDAFNAMRDSMASSHQALEELAFTDELTGLGNRKAFNDNIAEMRALPDGPDHLRGVMVVDLDYFKQVNDSFGHDAGDELLSVFASRLQQSVGPDDQVARIGGDEFAVILGALTEAQEATRTIDNIRAATSQEINYQGEVIVPSATIGIALESVQNLDADLLVKKADIALYEAKEAGRGGYCFYSPHVHEKATKLRRLTELMETVVPEEMFRLVYQPYVELATGRIVGVEVLLRCSCPECSDMPIVDIITILERTGNIAGVSEWAMKNALSQFELWRTTVDLPPDFTMSIDVSASLLRDDEFTQAVLDIVENSSVPGSSLIIEITETTVMEDYARSEAAMARLNAIGIEFAMDDFGTGYTSLVRLKEMPLTLLKIDQTFIKSMIDSPDDAAIVDAFLRLGHAIDMQVAAEGIETAEQAEALRELGCDRGQGCYFSYPVPADELDLTAPPQRFAA